jgi:Transposase and inactivated derivatives
VAKSVLNAPHFQNEEAAFAYVEAKLWPSGPVCPHCGNCDQKRIRKMQGKTTRMGLYKCNECRKPFTVRMGTIFESSHLPLHLWLQVIHLMCASKKGISTRQIQRMLQCSMKTAWFLTHRIREAMRSDDLTPFGGGGGYVEADETFIGRDPGIEPGKGGFKHKMKVLSLLDRNSGHRRSFVVDGVTIDDVTPILRENIAREAKLLTDDAGQYRHMHLHFASHQTTPHMKGVYVDRDNPEIHTNSIEGSFSVFKRGMRGIYQHCQKHHLHRYLAEFDFRYSNRAALGVEDSERADLALRGVVGKRLTYGPVGLQTA